MRFEPLSLVAFLLGGLAGITGYAWRKLRVPPKKES